MVLHHNLDSSGKRQLHCAVVAERQDPCLGQTGPNGCAMPPESCVNANSITVQQWRHCIYQETACPVSRQCSAEVDDAMSTAALCSLSQHNKVLLLCLMQHRQVAQYI